MGKKQFVVRTCLTQLSSVEEKIRNKGFRSIQNNIDNITEENMKSLSFGLYYYYWYSDKTSKQLQFLWELRAILDQLVKRNVKLFWAFIKNFLEVFAERFTKIDVYRTSKFLLFAKFIFYMMYGLDLESVLFDSTMKTEAKTTALYENFWSKDELKKNLQGVNEIITNVLMECASRKGLLFQYIYTVRDLFKRLFQLKRFRMMKELFLFVKPLLNMTAFTWNKKMRECLKEEFLDNLLKLLVKRGYKARARFAKFVLVYAKSPDLNEINRNIFYEFLEKVEDNPKINGIKQKEKKKKEEKKKEEKKKEEKEADMENELDEIDKELNKNKVSLIKKKAQLDIKSLNIGELVKRHYDKFTNEEVEADMMEDDEEYIPNEDDINGEYDLTKEAEILMEALTKVQRIEDENVEEDNKEDFKEDFKENDIIIETKNKKENQIVVEEDNKVVLNGDIKEDKGMVYELDMGQYSDLDLPDLDVEEEDGEFIFGGNMTYDDMKNKLPEYYFKSPKQKKKYFRKLTLKYKKNLDKNSDGNIKRKKINFDLKKNEKLVFKQKELIKKN